MPEIRVARLVSVGQPLEVGTMEKPVPGPKDVLVKVEACSLVPNSYNVVTGKAELSLPPLPCVFGLDAAGTIEAVGNHVLNLRVGDRVYVDPFLTCGTCHQCRRGQRDLCPSGCLRGYFSMTPGGAELIKHYPVGALSEYVLSPDVNVAVLPPRIDTATASRFGYFGTSFAGLKKAHVGPGKTVVINGVTGTLGFAAVAVALGIGCTKILGLGRNKERLAAVRGLGPENRIVVRSSEEEGDAVEWIKSHTDNLGADALYDCLGVGGDASSTSKLLDGVKDGGRVILAAGGADGEIVQKYWQILTRNVAVLGTMWFTAGELDEMMALMNSGVIDLSFLRHEFFSMENVNDAFEMVGDRPGGAVNVVVQPHV